MVSSKVLVIALAAFVSCFLTASSLICYKCEGDDTEPMCNMNETCSAANTQCLSQVEKDDDGKLSYKRGCTHPLSCSGKRTACKAQKLLNKLDDCAYDCCDTDRCNNEFPAFGSGVKVTSGFIAIVATLSFALFVI